MPGITSDYIKVKVEKIWHNCLDKPVYRIIDIFGPSRDCIPPTYLDDPKTTDSQKAAIEVIKAETLYNWRLLIRPNAEDLEKWYGLFAYRLFYDWKDSTERGKLLFYVGTFLTPVQWELMKKVLQDAATEFIEKRKEWSGTDECFILL